jgi:negative regulator of sigma E activity
MRAMSTFTTEPTPVPAEPTDTPAISTSEGTLADVEATETEHVPGFISRHTTTLITLMVAVIVAAAAIAGVALYRHNQDQANSATEAAFTQMLSGQGAAPETVECSGDTCSAVIQGQAYTVLVQEDAKGKQHFGVTNFVGK